ncbi:MAG TPA: hypothetical protein PKI12_06615 [Bacteroidales bacterium]|nr:hypothetical protein [Bacteroidales bacterium]
MKKRLPLLPLLLILTLPGAGILFGQTVYSPVSDYGIITFLDELASEGIISLNDAVKPYSRQQIAGYLISAHLHTGRLTQRQQKELSFFTRVYRLEVREVAKDKGLEAPENQFREPAYSHFGLIINPLAGVYHDSLFTITVRPIIGISGGHNQAGNCVTWHNGGEMFGTLGRFGFSAALRDHHQDPLLALPEYLTEQRGGHIKSHTDWSEVTGGITYGWKWGTLGLIKDAPVWGTSYAGSNIFSGRAPSFMQLRLKIKPVKWLEMNWLFGWLNSMVVDSTRSYWVHNAYGDDYREVYHKKYISASMFTLTPVKGVSISAGNSVIWSDERLTADFFMPLFFYKSVDHGANSGIDNSNSQMFIDLSLRAVKHLHLYGTLFIDEMATSRFKTSDYNFFSWKGGMRAGNIAPLKDLWFTAECTFTYPLAFQHYVPVLTFENQGYNLGHYLRDNSREWYFALDYRPLRAMDIRVFHRRAERGEDFQSVGGTRTGLPYINPVVWENISTGMEFSWQVTGGVYLNASYIDSKVTGVDSWTPEWLYGEKKTLTAGLSWSF